MCVGEKFACSVAFYFIDVDVLIRPGDAQKYASRRSFVLFSFVTLYLCRVRVASFLYFVIFSCTDRQKDVQQNKHLQCTICLWFFQQPVYSGSLSTVKNEYQHKHHQQQ